MLQLPYDSWREWLRETGFQGLLLFWGPANKIAAKLDVEKLLIAAELAYKLIVIYLD